jgi:hypothetical protein
MGIGRDEQAQELIGEILAKNPYAANAYAASAYLAVDAQDEAMRDLAVAKEDVAIARDMGGDQAVLHVQALIALAEGDKAKAGELLKQAAASDGYGFGAAYYRKEYARRMAGPGAVLRAK